MSVLQKTKTITDAPTRFLIEQPTDQFCESRWNEFQRKESLVPGEIVIDSCKRENLETHANCMFCDDPNWLMYLKLKFWQLCWLLKTRLPHARMQIETGEMSSNSLVFAEYVLYLLSQYSNPFLRVIFLSLGKLAQRKCPLCDCYPCAS